MLNEFWATASTTYKALVFSAMGLIAVGIILNLVGNNTGNQALALASLAVILLAVAVPGSMGDGRALASHVGCGAVITTDTTLDSDLVDCPNRGT